MIDHRPAEKSLLGAMLQSPDIVPEVAALIGPDSFGNPWHENLARLMFDLADKGDPWDLVVVCEEIATQNPDDFGGLSYPVSLPAFAGSSEAWPGYARAVRRNATARKAKLAGLALIDSLENGSDPWEAIATHEADLGRIPREDPTRDGWVPLAESVPSLMAEYAERERNPGSMSGLVTGWRDLDELTGGFQPADLIIVGARPSMGKTAWCLNLAMNAARRGVGVGMFSLEMSRKAIVTRMMCAEAMADSTRFRRAELEADERRRMAAASEMLEQLPLYVDERVGLTIQELRRRARRLATTSPNLGLLIVDYLQLARGGRKGASREQEVAEVSMGLKQIGRELKVPIVALAQLNRSLESRPVKERRPIPSDLRDSGQIEQDADVLIFLFREEVYDPMTPDKGIAEVILAKQRNGALGTVKLAWKPQYQRFDNMRQHHGAATGQAYYTHPGDEDHA